MVTSAYWVRLFGQLYIIEIILLLLLLKSFILNQRGISNCIRQYVGYFNLLALSMFGLVITDLIRGTEFESIAKGVALITFTAVNLFSLIVLTRNNLDHVLSAILGWSFGKILGVIIQPSEYALEFPWKFGVGYSTTLIFMIYISKLGVSRFRALTLAAILVSAHLIYGARSLAAITFIAVILSLSWKKSHTSNEIRKINTKKTFASILLMSFFAAFFYFSYSTLSSKGLLGEEAKAKYKMQSSSSLGLLISGRTEVVSAFIAIQNSPVIGYGSYAPLTEEIREKVVETLSKNGIAPTIKDLKYGVDYKIPVHSCIFQFWIWFGIAGVPFWAKMFLESFRAAVSRPITPILAFLSIQSLWDILFSPYAADRRIQIPLTIILLFVSRNKGLMQKLAAESKI